ncbi:allergenic cerato-platanin Asp F13 [Talaromyces proteolyticus]|uniref:Allergenic cerato-platanin Asp F13 n=1 Tax=Talaromyces proteolyticus TaxID=1131652 RepID=A0AAD4KHB1_9EURO|nr:allergenic cerato-platanin Asp F13 [Talaromyces proteolyticus]KAH8692343.1 allergenic cerato-platanin Asp F13 [Talaromyces proteolyticus]
MNSLTYIFPLITILSLSSFTFAAKSTSIATFDTSYDDTSLSLSTVTCSNGENGLMTKNYNTIADLPTPNVAGSPTVKAWNDPNCGACYALTYNNKTVNVLAIDSAIGEFNVALKVLNDLTNGHGQEFGNVEVVYEQVQATKCGMPAK